MSAEKSVAHDSLSLEALCRAAAGGDPEALARLLWDHHARLLGLAQCKIGPEWRGRIEPEDVLQEAYVDVFRRIGSFSFQGEDSFFHWVSMIVDHHLIDEIRHHSRKRRDSAREVVAAGSSFSRCDAFFDKHLQDSLTPSVALRRDEAIGVMLTCIARLPEPYQGVVRRVCLDGEPVSAVAADLDRSERAIRHLVERGIGYVRKCLGRGSRYLATRD